VSSPYQYVHEFHRVFGCPIAVPDTSDLRQNRQSLIDEEHEEVRWDMLWEEPLESVAKELADLVYVLYGTAIALGIDLDEAIRRVHESNMSKLLDDGVPLFNSNGKVLKGPNYYEPDMTGVVR
jgi:predicted HAD superfamily Cof-like phosphohydrolase